MPGGRFQTVDQAALTRAQVETLNRGLLPEKFGDLLLPVLTNQDQKLSFPGAASEGDPLALASAVAADLASLSADVTAEIAAAIAAAAVPLPEALTLAKLAELSLPTPTAIWSGGGTPNDQGSGGYNLSTAAGTLRYTRAPFLLDTRSFYFDGTLVLSNTDAVWRTDEEISVLVVGRLSAALSGARTLIGCTQGGGGDAANNDGWLLGVNSEHGELVYKHQYGTTSDESSVLSYGLGHERDFVAGFSRDSAGTGIALYLDGEVAKTETLSNAPAVGANADLYIGGYGGSFPVEATLGPLIVWVGEELSAADFRAASRVLQPNIPAS